MSSLENIGSRNLMKPKPNEGLGDYVYMVLFNNLQQ